MDLPRGIDRHFHPVLAADALGRAPARVVLGGRPWALWRDADGRPHGVADRCAHRFAPLSAGTVRPDGRLACPYHGWHFGPDGHGDSPHAPGLANCRVEPLRVVEHLGVVWIAAGGAAPAPALGWEGWEYAGHRTVRFEAPLHVCLDNFTENEHTPWVHQVLGWQASDADKVEFTFTPAADHTHVTYDAPQRPHPSLPLLGVKAGDAFHNDWVTRFDPVHSVYTLSWSDPATGAPRPLSARFCIYMVPETPTVTVYHSFLFVRIAGGWMRALAPVVKYATGWLGAREIGLDAAFIHHVADTPFELRGMRLTRYDHPLIAHRKMLRRLYLGEGEAGAGVTPRSPTP